MTDQEREIKRVISYIRSCRNAGIDTTITIDKSRNHFILNALEEIQQYRAVGTAEECREARERYKEKKWERGLGKDVRCPICGTYTTDIFEHRYCTYCGQRLV